MTVCKYCRADLIWIRMRSGKAMPCNTGKIPYRESEHGNMKLVTDDGRVISAMLCAEPDEADGIGYVSHYATCPGADRFRRK